MDNQIFKDQILSASELKSAVQIRGGGTKDWYGQTPRGEVLDTRSHTGIIEYEPTELVITARCGTPLAEIEAALAERHQSLAFEPPRFGAGATLGGLVASGLSGPSRQAVGALRDYVLGVVLMDGRGDVLHFGGQVMKNVAGYDVSRLLAGSLGTLGLILQASIKVLPLPIAINSRRFEVSETEALRWLNEWGGQPLPISASCWCDGVLTVRLSGAQAAVTAAQNKMGGDAVSDGDVFWHSVREQTQPFFDTTSPIWRLSVPSVTPPLALAGATLIEWGGAQRWLVVDPASAIDAREIRAAVSAVGGHATLYHGGDKSVGVFQPLAPAVAKIHHNLKATFDPAGVFNPGRMYPDM
ncbi:glycolate oxidase subunit GlcE [Glaciimonas immobilis]|uniref:Glycolate oxidase FAD binding subunit n=1 Tax=Glaciimonas immobilis TaxID=728004 RepID=A0A840RX15_9BURK|nr:glycolate oxidase subunit GlcE [Glaciimonas immobilis]KAF3997380.1 glycolate oxidase subunit GlcE [Glaciimonas immobilis]MBB5200959.1 glycolate oxidase FAD binding subunit [Glaciimonas immobilis]